MDHNKGSRDSARAETQHDADSDGPRLTLVSLAVPSATPITAPMETGGRPGQRNDPTFIQLASAEAARPGVRSEPDFIRTAALELSRPSPRHDSQGPLFAEVAGTARAPVAPPEARTVPVVSEPAPLNPFAPVNAPKVEPVISAPAVPAIAPSANVDTPTVTPAARPAERVNNFASAPTDLSASFAAPPTKNPDTGRTPTETGRAPADTRPSSPSPAPVAPAGPDSYLPTPSARPGARNNSGVSNILAAAASESPETRPSRRNDPTIVEYIAPPTTSRGDTPPPPATPVIAQTTTPADRTNAPGDKNLSTIIDIASITKPDKPQTTSKPDSDQQQPQAIKQADQQQSPAKQVDQQQIASADQSNRTKQTLPDQSAATQRPDNPPGPSDRQNNLPAQQDKSITAPAVIAPGAKDAPLVAAAPEKRGPQDVINSLSQAAESTSKPLSETNNSLARDQTKIANDAAQSAVSPIARAQVDGNTATLTQPPKTGSEIVARIGDGRMPPSNTMMPGTGGTSDLRGPIGEPGKSSGIPFDAKSALPSSSIEPKALVPNSLGPNERSPAKGAESLLSALGNAANTEGRPATKFLEGSVAETRLPTKQVDGTTADGKLATANLLDGKPTANIDAKNIEGTKVPFVVGLPGEKADGEKSKDPRQKGKDDLEDDDGSDFTSKSPKKKQEDSVDSVKTTRIGKRRKKDGDDEEDEDIVQPSTIAGSGSFLGGAGATVTNPSSQDPCQSQSPPQGSLPNQDPQGGTCLDPDFIQKQLPSLELVDSSNPSNNAQLNTAPINAGIKLETADCLAPLKQDEPAMAPTADLVPLDSIVPVKQALEADRYSVQNDVRLDENTISQSAGQTVAMRQEDDETLSPSVRVTNDEANQGSLSEIVKTFGESQRQDRDDETRASTLEVLNFDRPRSYKVKRGDTIESIALRELGDARLVPLLIQLNRAQLTKDKQGSYKLKPGATLRLPSPAETLRYLARSHASNETEFHSSQNKPSDRIVYTCRLGDTLKTIAQRHPAIRDARIWALIAHLNEIPRSGNGVTGEEPSLIVQRGQRLVLPNPEDCRRFLFEQTFGSSKLSSADKHDASSSSEGGAETSTRLSKGTDTSTKVSENLANEDSRTTVSFTPSEVLPTQHSETGEKTRFTPSPTSDSSLVSRVVSQLDLGDVGEPLVLKLELKLNGVWHTVVEYSVNGDTDESSIRVFTRAGKARKIKIELPDRAARELAENDLAVNGSIYCHNFIAEVMPF